MFQLWRSLTLAPAVGALLHPAAPRPHSGAAGRGSTWGATSHPVDDDQSTAVIGAGRGCSSGPATTSTSRRRKAGQDLVDEVDDIVDEVRRSGVDPGGCNVRRQPVQSGQRSRTRGVSSSCGCSATTTGRRSNERFSWLRTRTSWDSTSALDDAPCGRAGRNALDPRLPGWQRGWQPRQAGL